MKIGVVGAGIIGLATTYELVRRGGHEVRCYEAAIPMAARSTGDSRIFRLCHWEPELVKLAREARDRWRLWSAAANMPLLGDQGLVVSDPDNEALAARMRSIGVEVEIIDSDPRMRALSTKRSFGPLLHDRAAGVINAAETGKFLLGSIEDSLVRKRVIDIEIIGDDAVIRCEDQEWRCDSVVIAAGAGTFELIAPLGLSLPYERHHHARFTFRLSDDIASPPCWFDNTQAWRPGFDTYTLSPRPGYWSIGANLPPDETRWELGADQVSDTSRQTIQAYLAEFLPEIEQEIVDEVRCDFHVGANMEWNDGFSTSRVGPILAFWGENLFKFAPLLGYRLASAAVEFSPELTTLKN